MSYYVAITMVLFEKLFPGARSILRKNIVEIGISALPESMDDIDIQGALVLGAHAVVGRNGSAMLMRKSDPAHQILVDDTTDAGGGMYVQVKTPSGIIKESTLDGEIRIIRNFGDSHTTIALRHHR